jgi:AcrR family transcriptional regulator
VGLTRVIDKEKRELLALQAFEVIKRDGAYATSMSSLARELGLKRPTLYFYFPDMTTLFDTLLAHRLERTRQAVMAKMAPQRHPIRALIALIEATVEFHAQDRAEMIVLFELWAVAAGSGREQAMARERMFTASARSFLIAMVHNGIERGTVRSCDAEGLVDLVLTCLEGNQVRLVTGIVGIEGATRFLITSVLEPLIEGGAS